MSNVTFVLDEAASLGRMDALDDAVDKYRGYGVRLQFYFQSVSQLKKCFPDGQEQTLLSNVSQVFFSVNDLPTAEYVSNRLGESTIVVGSGGTSTGTSQQMSGKGEAAILARPTRTAIGPRWGEGCSSQMRCCVCLSGSPSPSHRKSRPSGRRWCGTTKNPLSTRSPGYSEQMQSAVLLVVKAAALMLLVYLIAMCL